MYTKSVSLGTSRTRRESQEERHHTWGASVLSNSKATWIVHSLLVLKGWQESKCPSASEWINRGPSTPWTTIPLHKKKHSRYTQQPGWISNALRSVEEARLKRLHAAWVPLADILKKTENTHSGVRGCQGLGKELTTEWQHKGTAGREGIVLYPNCHGNYTFVKILWILLQKVNTIKRTFKKKKKAKSNSKVRICKDLPFHSEHKWFLKFISTIQ